MSICKTVGVLLNLSMLVISTLSHLNMRNLWGMLSLLFAYCLDFTYFIKETKLDTSLESLQGG